MSMDYNPSAPNSATHAQIYGQTDPDQAFTNLHNGGSPPSHHHQICELMNIITQKASDFPNSPVTTYTPLLPQDTPWRLSDTVPTRRHPPLVKVIV
jgi:hypothetical protein